MKKFWAVVLIIAAGAGWFLIFQARNSQPEKSPAPNGISSENNSAALSTPGEIRNQKSEIRNETGFAANTTSPSDLASRAASPNPSRAAIATTNEAETLPPLTVLDKARVAIHNYNATFGENPIGTNPEITAALTGKNPKQLNFVTPESGLRVNDKGELVDAYGTPFFFHQLSAKEMEIHSAGMDRKMWTFDDLVTR
jgi:hypothetical protein